MVNGRMASVLANNGHIESYRMRACTNSFDWHVEKVIFVNSQRLSRRTMPSRQAKTAACVLSARCSWFFGNSWVATNYRELSRTLA